MALKVTADTIAQKVAPGVTDLKKAESIKVTDVALGDRVLATRGTRHQQSAAHRGDVGHGHCEEERSGPALDWTRRGVHGHGGCEERQRRNPEDSHAGPGEPGCGDRHARRPRLSATLRIP